MTGSQVRVLFAAPSAQRPNRIGILALALRLWWASIPICSFSLLEAQSFLNAHRHQLGRLLVSLDWDASRITLTTVAMSMFRASDARLWRAIPACGGSPSAWYRRTAMM
jgi:hypothetical protein